jgi:TnpA family transposase
MVAIHETAYPRLKPSFTPKELIEVFLPTDEELLFIKKNTRKSSPAIQLGFLLTLKYYQYIGRPILVRKIQPQVQRYIESYLGLDNINLVEHYTNQNRIRHIKRIRDFLGIKSDKSLRKEHIKKAALKASEQKTDLADIINHMLEEVIKDRFELPVFSKFVRLAKAARSVVNNGYYSAIFDKLTKEQISIIDALLFSSTDDGNVIESGWYKLKQEPKKPTYKNIRLFIEHAKTLIELRETLDANLENIPPSRLEYLRDAAQSLDIADLNRIRESRRYALIIIYIHIKTAMTIDDLCSIFILWIRKIGTQADLNLEKYRIKHASNTDELILAFYNMLLIMKDQKTDKEKMSAIEHELGGNIDDILEKCQAHINSTKNKSLSWMVKPFSNKRSVLFCILENLKIRSSSQDNTLITAVQFIIKHRYSRKEWIDIDYNAEELKEELDILSDRWFKTVTQVSRGSKVQTVNKNYYEIAIFSMLADELQCGDVYVAGGFLFDDPNKKLISWDEFKIEKEKYCATHNFPKTGAELVARNKSALRDASQKTDLNYENNAWLSIEGGRPILKKLPAIPEHPDTEKIKQMIMKEMPKVSIVDVIVDIERWFSLSLYFKPISGYDTKIIDYPSRFVSTSFAYGSNIGPTQAERSLSTYTRKQIAWIFNHHVNEDRLLKTIRHVINKFNLFDLPFKWGTGESKSVDGTFIDMYKQNLLAAKHIRYGGTGGIGYFHISDKYIALYSDFVSSACHESIFLFDDVPDFYSDIRPDKIHGDSWAQSEVLFGLAFFMSIKLMPRIKNFKDLNFYKAYAQDKYKNIGDLFTTSPIDWDILETHFDDMFRSAISIQKGKIKASTLLRKLCSKSRKNKLYFAFRELGRVQRTIFLLEYINDPELRRMIQAATCKSEEFNEFLDWIRFGDGGVIGDNLRGNQKKVVRYGHLLANMTMLHTVINQTKAINKLKESGVLIVDEVLSGMGCYWTEHLNRLGKFLVEMDKEIAEIEYAIK